MGICAKELKELVIQPTLTHLGVKGERAIVAENLLLGTAAQESGLGSHLKLKRSRGLGIYSITPKTHQNIWDKYLINYPNLASAIRGLASQQEFLVKPHAELATNLSYATAIAWMIYRRSEKNLPKSNDTLALGEYWATHFHHKPKACAKEFVHNYQQFIIRETSDIAA